jgi:hypothetical protein
MLPSPPPAPHPTSPPATHPATHPAVRIWIAAVFVVYLVACLHEAFGPFVIGHDGFNGAAFSQAARNSLRFGILQQVQYYTGFEHPPLAEVYTNHPMLLHVHLIGVFGIAGIEPWIARLVPLVYSLAFFILLGRMTARRASPVTAAIALTLWTLTPLHTIFANMVNHEQGGLFWCLFLVDRYLVLQAARRADPNGPPPAPTHPATPRAREWPIYVAVTCAMQFDWVGYYFAFFIGAHALASAIIAPAHDGRRSLGALFGRLGFTLRFSVVVVLNAIAFFGWIAILRGGLGAMGDAFNQRSHRPDGYADLLLDRSLDMYGAGLLTLLAIWLVWALVRVARGRASAIDFIPWTFALAQLIHSTVFQSAGAIHSYWTFYAGPALAIGGALVLRAAWDALVGALGRATHNPRKAALVIAVPIMLVATAAQARYAVTRHIAGHDNHRGSYLEGVSDEWLETQWARWLHQRFGRDGTCYVVHPSADRTIHVLYYLDAPRQDGFRALAASGWRAPPADGCERQVLLVDLERLPVHQHPTLADLGRAHGAHVLDRRLVSVDLLAAQPPNDTPWLEADLLTPRPAPWWWTWLVNSRNPPFHIEPDPDRAWLADGGLLDPETRGRPHFAGGTTGIPREARCPHGGVVTGLRVYRSALLVGGVAFACAILPDTTGDDGAPSDEGPMCTEGFMIGRPHDSNGTRIDCPGDTIVTGLRGRAGTLIDAIGPICTAPRPAQSQAGRPNPLQRRMARLEGGPGGADFNLDCPSDERLVGVEAFAGDLVDGVSPLCAAYPLLRTAPDAR